MGKKIFYIVVAIIAFMFAFMIRGFMHDKKLLLSFDHITIGDSQCDVLTILGNPKFRVKGCDWEFAQRTFDISCSETYLYASAFAPLIPEYPVIWFDNEKHVIDKYVYSSP